MIDDKEIIPTNYTKIWESIYKGFKLEVIHSFFPVSIKHWEYEKNIWSYRVYFDELKIGKNIFETCTPKSLKWHGNCMYEEVIRSIYRDEVIIKFVCECPHNSEECYDFNQVLGYAKATIDDFYEKYGSENIIKNIQAWQPKLDSWWK